MACIWLSIKKLWNYWAILCYWMLSVLAQGPRWTVADSTVILLLLIRNRSNEHLLKSNQAVTFLIYFHFLKLQSFIFVKTNKQTTFLSKWCATKCGSVASSLVGTKCIFCHISCWGKRSEREHVIPYTKTAFFHDLGHILNHTTSAFSHLRWLSLCHFLHNSILLF